MRRVAVAAALVAASCGTATVEPADSIASGRPYRDLPVVPHRKTPLELPEQFVVPARAKKARPSRSRPTPPPRATTPPAAGTDIWAALARCESGTRQDAVGEGVHYSYFQWKLATWRSVKAAGDPADPREASYEAQVAAAQRLQARNGWGQWPACSRKIGLR